MRRRAPPPPLREPYPRSHCCISGGGPSLAPEILTAGGGRGGVSRAGARASNVSTAVQQRPTPQAGRDGTSHSKPYVQSHRGRTALHNVVHLRSARRKGGNWRAAGDMPSRKGHRGSLHGAGPGWARKRISASERARSMHTLQTCSSTRGWLLSGCRSHQARSHSWLAA